MDETTTAAENTATESKAIFSFTIDDIMAVVAKILSMFKNLMAWLGILVLPEKDELQ